MDLGLKGRTAVITGGSMGIGKAAALGLAAEGVNVVLLARGQEALDATAAEIKGQYDVEVMPISIDLTQRDTVDRSATQVREKLGTVHILVNNAGHRMRRMDSQLEWEDEDWLGDVDIKMGGMMRAIRAYAPLMPDDGTGRIINVSGSAGISVFGPALTHGWNNAAMAHVSGYVARELASRNILVNTVLPGLVSTEWRHGWAQMMADRQGKSKDQFLDDESQRLGILQGRWGSPLEIANVIVFLASDRASYINGAKILVDGGYGVNPR